MPSVLLLRPGLPANQRVMPRPPELSRRRLTTALAGLALPPAAARPDPGLGPLAAAHGCRYGAAIRGQLFAADPRIARIAADECGMLMTDYEVKWGTVQPNQGYFNFAPVDTLAAWAQAHGKTLRGHGLVWYQDMPFWTIAALLASPKQAYNLLDAHIAEVLKHTRTAIREWDVVNEMVADPPGSDVPQASGEIRNDIWLKALGPSYIAHALRLVHAHDPGLRIAINDYGTEENAPHHIEKRRRLLSLVRGLRRENVSLDTVGLQGHLQLVQPFSGPPFTQFCRDLRAEGVELVVTEMDVRENWWVPQGIPARDKLVAERVKAFMDAALEGGIKTFITWGLCDKYSWLASNPDVRRTDGLVHRGLPFSDDYARKPYWGAMADAFRQVR